LLKQLTKRLADFSLKWDGKFPMITKSWRSNWTRVIPFFAHPPEIRKVIYTTNAIESLNMSLRKVTKARGSFPNDEAVSKLLYLAAQPRQEVDQAGARVEGRAQSLRHHLRQPLAGQLSPGAKDKMQRRRQNPGGGNCRAMEAVEKQTAFSHRSHSAWKTRQAHRVFHSSHSPYCC
jgi:hypothetical protein